MKSQMLLLHKLLDELSSWCGASTDNDWKTIVARVKHEGISFLTISLSSFGSDFQKSLDSGYVDRNSFKGFAFGAGLPRFLGGFLDLVFDRGTGVLLENPSIDAIFSVLQVTLLHKKILIDCSEERVSRAIDGYLQCESDIVASDATGITSNRDFRVVSDMLFGRVLNQLDSLVGYQELMPRHGPGSTAERLLGNSKYNQTEWTERLQDVFPWKLYLASSYELAESRLAHRLLIREPGAERPVRVITVPKTLKTPRIIAIEPTCMMFMQQAIQERLYALIDEDDISSMFVSFLDQVPNQVLAKEGSQLGNLATLDLSEASDRVSNQLVRNMLHNYPSLGRAVDATRSRKADVPGHGVKRLAKFASMGSALCFPIETMVFLTLVFLGIQDGLNTPLTLKRIKSFKGQVRIYGDDIIVPVEYVPFVINRLQTFGFKVNVGKSFWAGKLRESCGKYYYDGEDITVSYLRNVIPTSRTDVSAIASLVAFRNQAFGRGLWQTVRHLDTVIEGLIPFPAVEETSQCLGKLSFLPIIGERTHPTLHVPLVRGARLKSRFPINRLDDYGALLKFFLKRGDEPIADRNHLERSGRPNASALIIRWLPTH